jgi:hypothetical protein
MILELKDVVNLNGLSMTDHERIDIINYVYDRLREHRNLVSYYTRRNISIAYLRAKKAGDSDRVAALYGNANDNRNVNATAAKTGAVAGAAAGAVSGNISERLVNRE